ncbi:MAG: hypothetical protein B6245_11390 [Desulfobacteraceae bacterium 4572_88]|nr:MAG: hypothetical protein B6245_11390 [Desulfobacteraceae bacterium 4572_88]
MTGERSGVQGFALCPGPPDTHKAEVLHSACQNQCGLVLMLTKHYIKGVRKSHVRTFPHPAGLSQKLIFELLFRRHV